MLKNLLKKKFKSEKGLTGVDIVVASTIIVVSVSVVIAIFVNITNLSRNVTRTSGATKIATNIVENIELSFYEDVLYEFNTNIKTRITGAEFQPASGKHFATEGTYIIEGSRLGAEERVFSTRIPRGYTLKIIVSNYYGYKPEEFKKYDLVEKIDVNVLFNVGGLEKTVSLSTIKARETLKTLANNPIYNKDVNVFSTTTVNKEMFELQENTTTIKLKFNSENYDTETGYSFEAANDDRRDFTYTNDISLGKMFPAMVIDISQNKDSGADHYYDVSSGKVIKRYVSGTVYNSTTRRYEDVYSSTKYKDYIYVWVPVYKKSGNSIIYRYKDTVYSTKTIQLTSLDSEVSDFYTVNKSDSTTFRSATGAEGMWVRLSDLLSNQTTTVIKKDELKQMFNFKY